MTVCETSTAKNFYVVSYWEMDLVSCPIPEWRNTMRRDCHQAYEVDTKVTLFTRYVSLYIRNLIS